MKANIKVFTSAGELTTLGKGGEGAIYDIAEFVDSVARIYYTLPELQTLPSFVGFERTENHENFGLALLLFSRLVWWASSLFRCAAYL